MPNCKICIKQAIYGVENPLYCKEHKQLDNKKLLSKKKCAIKIQSWYRGCKTRRTISSVKDNFSQSILLQKLELYKSSWMFNDVINKKLIIKKIRHENFPSEITENIVKFFHIKRYKIAPSWDIIGSDLMIKIENCRDIRIEVKGFSSTGPTSFGPTEKWDKIYFVNAVDFKKDIFQIYEINLSNNCKKWKSIKINQKETFEDQAKLGKRPRLCFKDIKKQLEQECKLVFDGNITELFK